MDRSTEGLAARLPFLKIRTHDFHKVKLTKSKKQFIQYGNKNNIFQLNAIGLLTG